MDVLLSAVVLLVLAGLAALACSPWPRLATACGAGGAAVACVLGLAPTIAVLCGGATMSARYGWDVPHGDFCVELDALSAFFLVPVLGLGTLAAIYGSDYLYVYRHDKSLGVPWFFFNLFIAGMVLVLIARTALLFLMAWEVMSLAAYFLVTFEHENAEVRRAGWIYLIATHLGGACLVIAFVLLGWHADSLEFAKFRELSGLGAGGAGVIFVLALLGFGTKAGFVPMHVWLPEAHAAAPSHVSALMSGVMIKMGLYGLLRVVTFLGTPETWWGMTLMLVGLITALVGITLALQQRDIKRVLAYSSIENMGLIGLAVGIGLTGQARAEPAVAVLGMTAALLHVWNHAIMKGLMFLAAGSIVHATGTRDMEHLGGLMKRMPWTAGAMMTGAVALAALPPLNGFLGKWLIYLGLMRDGLAGSGGLSLISLLLVGVLALIGGLAAIAFLRLAGIVLLGQPRSDEAERAHESSRWLLVPMALLVVLCAGVAIMPGLVVDQILEVVDAIVGWDRGRAAVEWDTTQTPVESVGIVNICLLIVFAASALGIALWLRKRPAAQGPTWGCGYARPTPRMQYTGRSFVEMIAEHLLPRFLRPRTRRRPPQGLFPERSRFTAESPDPVSDKVYEPFFLRWAYRFTRLHVLQQGKIHVYLIYIVITVVAALTWLTIRS